MIDTGWEREHEKGQGIGEAAEEQSKGVGGKV